MSRPMIDAARLIAQGAVAVMLGVWLAGCSDTSLSKYLDRTDTITIGAGDAIAANKVTEVVDPWPAASGNKNIAFNGDKMQAAVQRYRTGKVIQPVDPENAESSNQASSTGNQTTGNAGGSAPAISTGTATASSQ
jgi:hypothetical protein